MNKRIATVLSIALLSFRVSAQDKSFALRSDFPGGNILVDSIRNNTIFIRPDLRDTGQDWFYWYFAITPQKSDSIYFRFTRPSCLTVTGPAVSTDGGKSWDWLKTGSASPDLFTYYGKAGQEVRFSMGMPYTEENFHSFIKPYLSHPAVRVESLCTTPKGRSVEKLVIASPSPAGARSRQKVLITARHHSCEMMASYVLEGIISTILSGDKQMTDLSEKAEFWIIPFIDKDGVEDGDQGKARIPRDHNRDYDGKSIYCSTGALRNTVPAWSDGKLVAAFDLHCPWIKGNLNEHIYIVGNANASIAKEQEIFAKIITRNNSGEVKYDIGKGIVPFGTAWNTAGNYTQGTSFAAWASGMEGVKLSTTFEIPYSVNNGQLLNPENLRSFGRDLAFSISRYLQNIR